MNVLEPKDQADATQSRDFLRGGSSGVFMGLADSIPGVSGGTVALVLGIYSRWITAISHFDQTFLGLIRKGHFGKAVRHVDLIFLVGLAVGIATGFVVGVFTVSKLLDDDIARRYLFCIFIGMVAASVLIVQRMINENSATSVLRNVLITVISAAFAAAVTFASPSQWDGGPPLWYIFAAAAIAICAMILPGISGALLLLILGVYKYLLDVARQLLHMEFVGHNLLIVSVFGLGALMGLLGFSKLLRKLLQDYTADTLLVLRGLMIGSIAALWPFQHVNEHSAEKFGKNVFVRYVPDHVDGHWIGMIFSLVLAFVLVAFIDRWARNKPVSPVNG